MGLTNGEALEKNLCGAGPVLCLDCGCGCMSLTHDEMAHLVLMSIFLVSILYYCHIRFYRWRNGAMGTRGPLHSILATPWDPVMVSK